MEKGNRFALKARSKIDQQVAATDEVHARERRVSDHVLLCKDNHFSERLADAVSSLLFREKLV